MRASDAAFQSVFRRTFVYNTLWEDTEVDERYLDLDERSRVLSITGAGCGVAGMVSARPVSMDMCDINRHHLALSALKTAGAQHIESQALFYDLFGRGWHADPRTALGTFIDVLPAWMQRYWKRHWHYFERSLYSHGLLAELIRQLRRAIGSNGAWLASMAALPPSERARVVDEWIRPVLQRPWFRAVLSSPVQLVSLGINFTQRDRILAAEGEQDIVECWLQHLHRVAATDLATNWFAWWVLAGHYNHEREDAVPPWLRRDRHERAVGAPTVVRHHHRNLFDVMSDRGRNTWTHYTLCDMPDWLDDFGQRRLLDEVLRTSRDGAIVLYRTVGDDCIVDRQGAGRYFRRLDDISERATAEERSRQYRHVHFYRVEHA